MLAIHLIPASYLTLCLFLNLNIFIGFKEDLDRMDVVEPSGIPVKTKRLSLKRKKDRNVIGPQGGGGGGLHMAHMLLLSLTLLLCLWNSTPGLNNQI